MKEKPIYKTLVTLTVIGDKPIKTVEDFILSQAGGEDAHIQFKAKSAKITRAECITILAQ